MGRQDGRHRPARAELRPGLWMMVLLLLPLIASATDLSDASPTGMKVVLNQATGEVSLEFDDSSLAFQIGLGSRFFVFGKGSNLALRAELSWLFEDSFDDWAGHPSLAIGLMWRIRGERN